MSIVRNTQFGLPILRVRGALNNLSWADFIVGLKESLDPSCPHIALDLSWVTQMGRAQALLLSDARDSLARQGIKLSIVGLSPAVIEAMGAASNLRRRYIRNHR